MKALRTSFDDKLFIGATSVVGAYAVPCSIFIFKRKFPDAVIRLILGNRRQVIDQLQTDSIDVAVVEGEKPDDQFQSSGIYNEEMVVVAPANETWKTHPALDKQQLLTVPLIMREAGSATKWAVEQAFIQAGISPSSLNVVMELNSVDSIKTAVEAGYGISILPRMAVKKELFSKTFFPLRVEGLSFVQQIHLVYKCKKHRIIAAEFIKLMKSSSNGFC